jgi:hypothetical protein
MVTVVLAATGLLTACNDDEPKCKTSGGMTVCTYKDGHSFVMQESPS